MTEWLSRKTLGERLTLLFWTINLAGIAALALYALR